MLLAKLPIKQISCRTPTVNFHSQEISIHSSMETVNYWLWFIASLVLQYYLNTKGKRRQEGGERTTLPESTQEIQNHRSSSLVLCEWSHPLAQSLRGLTGDKNDGCEC